MAAVAFIFARGGSKGLPGKNVLPFYGKPLIAWSIEQAMAVQRIERIIVSTDSEEIADIARCYGAEVPFLRPKELAQDTSPEWLAWRHALNYLSESAGAMPEVMISVPATSPLRSVQDLESCLDEYEKGDVDVVIAVAAAHRSPYFNMVKVNGDGTVSLVNPLASAITRRQDVPVVYDMTTVCYVANPNFVMRYGGVFEGRVRAVQVPVERSIDIDTLLDFKIAEYLWGVKKIPYD